MKKGTLSFLFAWLFICLRAQTLTPEQLCNSTIAFINEMGTHNFQNFITKDEVTGMPGINGKAYKSNTAFPTATSTIIEDTSAGKKYRTAYIIYARTTAQTQELNPPLLRIYDNLNMVFQACLEPSKFMWTEMLNGSHIKQMNYTLEVPGAFNPTMSNYLMMKLFIDVEKTEVGLYLQQIKIEFTIL